MALDVSSRSAEHERLLALAAETMPGGTLGYFRLPDDVTLVVREGRGSKLYDVDGREYVDYVLGSGPMLVGHAHPQQVRAGFVCARAETEGESDWQAADDVSEHARLFKRDTPKSQGHRREPAAGGHFETQRAQRTQRAAEERGNNPAER